MLKDEFVLCCLRFVSDHRVVEGLWREINTEHSTASRHYHNLTHLNAILKELKFFKEKVVDWEMIVFAIAYHDLVYNVLSKENEERSAATAVERLRTLSVPEDRIGRCRSIILATKSHAAHDYQTDLFTDADLSILGAGNDLYDRYTVAVRKEYWIYPDFMYNSGRKKVLNHFLRMERIFKTPEFFEKYERSARENLRRELKRIDPEA